MLNEEENLTAEYLEEKSRENWEKMRDDTHYQKLEKDRKSIENCSLYLEFKDKLKRLDDEEWQVEAQINWAISALEEAIAVHGRFDEEHWAVRRLSELNRLPIQERIEKIIQANKEGASHANT